MELGVLAGFWVVSFSLVMTPGADWAYAISSGLREKAITPAVSGMLLGYLVITLVVAAGVGALVASFPSVLTALTLIGAVYLLYLGIGVLRNPPVPKAGSDTADTWTKLFIRGFLISGINPKALLLFLALLPQFTRTASDWPVAGQIAALGLVQIVNCAVVYFLVGIASRAVLTTRPTVARRISQLSGAAMLLIGLLLLAEQAFRLPA